MSRPWGQGMTYGGVRAARYAARTLPPPAKRVLLLLRNLPFVLPFSLLKPEK